MSIIENYNYVGVGVSYKENYAEKLIKHYDIIDCLEVKPEDYFDNIPQYTQQLHILREVFPLIAHGLFLSVGSFEGLDRKHVAKLNSFFKHSPKFLWLSEHMGCTRAGGINLPHFINVPHTKESVDIISRNINLIQKSLNVPVIFENIPWEFSYPESDFTEAEMFSRIVEKTNCGLLFDVSNLYANHINFGWNIDDYLDALPIENIYQVHFTGGFFNKLGKYIDSHSTATHDTAWEILKSILERGANIKALILERDDAPDLDELVDELIKARNIITKHKKWD